jgi:hypothetical protein
MQPSTEQALSLLRDSLAEAQATVRSYDSKAQIVGIGYIFALGIVGALDDLVPDSTDSNVVKIVVGWIVVILPIVLFGFVLYPSRKMVRKLADEPEVRPKHVLYVDPKRLDNVEALKEAASGADPPTEVAFELLKVSMLRELKRQRFLRALWAAGICFIVLFTSQFTRSF